MGLARDRVLNMSWSRVPGGSVHLPRATTTRGGLPAEPSGSEREAAILRLPLEPCIYYPEMTVHREIMSGLCGFMDALERFYRAWACGEAAVT